MEVFFAASILPKQLQYGCFSRESALGGRQVHSLGRLQRDLYKYMEHLRDRDCDGALILLDLEDQLPCQEAPALAEAIAALQPLPFPVVIVFAHKEDEAWFLAGIASLAAQSSLFADDLTYPQQPGR